MKEKLESLSQEDQKLVAEARTIRLKLIELAGEPTHDYYQVFAAREMGLVKLGTDHPAILILQYHCAVALPNKFSLRTLLANNLEVCDYILDDDLLTKAQKADIFQSYISETLLNLNLARSHVTCQHIEAAISCSQALENTNNALVTELYYEAAVYYREISKPRKAIECCSKICDYHPANHLLALIIVKEQCRIPDELRNLFCLHLLKTASNLDNFQELICSLLGCLGKFTEGESLDSLIHSALYQKEWAIALAEKRLMFWQHEDKVKPLSIKHSIYFSFFNTLPKDIEGKIAVTTLNLSLI